MCHNQNRIENEAHQQTLLLPHRLGAMPEAAPLHIVSGKGGTGKTAVSLALAHLLARSTGDVLVCEVEERHDLTGVMQVAMVPPGAERQIGRDGGAIRALSVAPRQALTDYLDHSFRLGLAGKVLEMSGLVDFVTELAPGLQDVLLIGKVYQASRRQMKEASDAVQAVILDAPPTGRIETFLTAGEALAEVVTGGPIRHQAESIMDLLRSETTRVHLVTTLSEMAVTETLTTLASLRKHRIRPGRVIANLVPDEVPELPPLDDPDHRVARAHAAEKMVVAAQQPWRRLLTETLAEAGMAPLVNLPLLPDEVDAAAVRQLADLLQPQWRTS